MSKSANKQNFDRLIAKRENLFRRVQLCYEAGEQAKINKSDSKKLESF